MGTATGRKSAAGFNPEEVSAMKGTRAVGILIVALAASIAFVAAGATAGEKGEGGKGGKSTKPAEARPPADSANIAAGAKTFASLCVLCHGTQGKGDGPGSKGLNPKPRNFSDPTQFKSKTDEELFSVIQRGGASAKLSAAMPPWGAVLKRDQIWQVIAYVHTLAKLEAKPEAKSAPTTGK